MTENVLRSAATGATWELLAQVASDACFWLTSTPSALAQHHAATRAPRERALNPPGACFVRADSLDLELLKRQANGRDPRPGLPACLPFIMLEHSSISVFQLSLRPPAVLPMGKSIPGSQGYMLLSAAWATAKVTNISGR